jgi:putative PIN family toxin of toxin-antitoxin system
VLDTNLIVAALRSDRGASRKILEAALERRIRLVASVPLMVEYEAVLTRPEHLAAARLTSGEVNAILDSLAAVCEPVALGFLWRPRLKDPGDEMVLETAVNGQVRRLVTFNVSDFRPVARQFGVLVQTPLEAWKEVLKYEEK